MSVIVTSLEDGVLDVLLDRPEVENAIDAEMLEGIARLVDEIEGSPAVHGVLLHGAGRSFCTGLDPRAAGGLAFYPSSKERPYVGDILSAQWQRGLVWRRLVQLSKPLVTAVQGRALGEGALLVMVSSLSFAAPDAEFGDPAIRMGMTSANPLWLWHVGPRHAREIYFGRSIDAQTAHRWGLISSVVTEGDVLEAAREGLLALMSHESGMTGSDGHAAHVYLNRTNTASAGVWTAFDFAQGLAGSSAIQRGGFRPGEYDFWARVEENGIEAALAERDQRYAAYAITSEVSV
jgi:enoyl-CoA hydratase/carnithine racemase